jgi:hypothetical protein
MMKLLDPDYCLAQAEALGAQTVRALYGGRGDLSRISRSYTQLAKYAAAYQRKKAAREAAIKQRTAALKSLGRSAV